ncbi:MAG: hypothetical protein UV80_C0008G0034 [Candidatus Peregrinibacteria bacterium GW2011_GWF2_43_17]|nr:MAG: hypothetical protein UV80_C0008G0034 [Candidatus Peregrinibacteria bacterium GW2011_GWF2_43_17]KKT18905.1 MAG: hypothetical protein UW03_C0028G0021 [Candidatus Peregrinibacteria bacterium GW2011_GWA2_43_8]HAU39500.1 hypothetical protein [Candidatus Peregrinibacteria bacterium]
MNKTLATLLTILLTAIIVGGGVYFWQQSQLESLQDAVEVLQTENEDLKNDMQSIEDEENTTLEGDYVNEKYGYSLDLLDNFQVLTEGYDNDGTEDESTIWVGQETEYASLGSYWTEGFFIRVLDTDLMTAYSETLTDAKENCVAAPYPNTECDVLPYSEGTQDINGVEAKTITYGTEIGYEVVKYYLEVNNHIFEIQVVNSNDDAQNVIQTIQFAE